jgi:hypothetical protein
VKAGHRDVVFIGLGVAIVALLFVLVMSVRMVPTSEDDHNGAIYWPVPPTIINVTVEQPKVCDQGGMLQRMCEAGATK